MGRTAKFTEDQFMDAVLDLMAERGPAAVTISLVAGKLHAPIGSVYHRFVSRDVLLARLWLRTVQSFQQGFLRLLDDDDGLAAALYTPQWARANPKEGKLLLLYRREELVSGPWPEEIQEITAHLAAKLDRGIIDFVRHRFGRVTSAAVLRTTFALIDVPYAAVRRSLLSGGPPPAAVDELVSTSYHAIMGGTA